MADHFDRRLSTLHANLAHLASLSREPAPGEASRREASPRQAPSRAVERRAAAVGAARQCVLALGQARGAEGLRAAIVGVQQLARDEIEEALGTYQNVDLALGLAAAIVQDDLFSPAVNDGPEDNNPPTSRGKGF